MFRLICVEQSWSWLAGSVQIKKGIREEHRGEAIPTRQITLCNQMGIKNILLKIKFC